MTGYVVIGRGSTRLHGVLTWKTHCYEELEIILIFVIGVLL